MDLHDRPTELVGSLDRSKPHGRVAGWDAMVVEFAARFERVRRERGPLAWGLDPSGELLANWGLGDTPDGLERFVDIVVPVAADTIGIVKPQSAFFERHGWRGVRALTRLVDEARSAELLVVLDVKRGDVGSTNDAYAEAPTSGTMRRSPPTRSPCSRTSGWTRSFVDGAVESGSCLLIVTRSSDPEGRSLQAALGAGDRTVEQALLDRVGELNARLAPARVGPIGAVIGPTRLEPRLDLAAPHTRHLAPGVGRQGATPEDVAEVFAACPDRVIPARRGRWTRAPIRRGCATTSTPSPASSSGCSSPERTPAGARRAAGQPSRFMGSSVCHSPVAARMCRRHRRCGRAPDRSRRRP